VLFAWSVLATQRVWGGMMTSIIRLPVTTTCHCHEQTIGTEAASAAEKQWAGDALTGPNPGRGVTVIKRSIEDVGR
jgi:hypothetical protein